ncbi:hypothetical protein [Cyclobacterium plantarum]|uniref:Uncharacterized protein n=1 Tax=Cyclobacterium plantarum TaxID=2716263 RepID=A0ABX0HAA1_9BACT|nr:hypothetical protein [Cyclobacterium plantarum]NHE57151.1 hypothetical protein [Cyclobacterium plantarum]
MKKFWILLSFSNFLIAALFGLVLRAAFVWEIDWMEYRNLLHAHSHLAMLGWVYMGIFALFCHRFVPLPKSKAYPVLFWITQISVIGMMISFPLQGYAAISISFSTMHILASYVFCYRIWRDQRIPNPSVKKLFYAALVFLILSTLGVWVLGPLAVSGGRNTALYQVAIQFYLHFQFHGWFTFAILALLLDALLKQQWKISKQAFSWFYYLFITATVLTFGLVLFWAYGNKSYWWLNNLGIILQLIGIGLFLKIWQQGIGLQLKQFSARQSLLFRFGLISWIAKIGIQSMVIFPEAAVSATTIRPLMMGFIHLTVLGFVSAFLIYFFTQLGFFRAATFQFLMISILFISGFLLTEILLFSQGLFYWMHWGQLPFYHELLFVSSAFLPLSIILFIFQSKAISKEKKLIKTEFNIYN